jgi:hypothetical protein
MKEITECIGNIGRANSTIFTTLDLTSGFWQVQLDKDSQKFTAFTIPGKGQFHWITSPMGLFVCPASFQRLMEGVLRDIPNVLCIHRQSASPHRHSREAFTSTGSGAVKITQESSQDKFGNK